MKKQFLILTCLALVASSAGARNPIKEQTTTNEPCQYTVMQNLIRDARDHEKVFELIRAGVQMEDPSITCGGSLLQLAVRRGNPSILNGILTQDKARANAEVSLKGFPIAGAPDTIPAVLFAAYYAPSETVFNVMLEAEADITIRDKKGHGILWYLNQNPVLRKTALEDRIQANLQNRLLDQAHQPDTTAKPDEKAEEAPAVEDSTLAQPEE